MIEESARQIERAFPSELLPGAEDVLLALAGRFYTTERLTRIVGRDRMIQSSLYVEGKAEGKTVKTVNALCAVHTDDAVDPTVTTTYKGKLIGFCCEDCKMDFDRDPEKYAAKLK